MAIKKAYVELIDFLTTNKDKKVSTILGDVQEMCSAKSAGGVATTVHRNEAGDITHVRCSYFKQWMPLSHVEFGRKAGSASGLNPMCKEGTSNFSKQQREFRKGKEALMDQLVEEQITADEYKASIAKLEEVRTSIIPRRDGIGFDTIEEALEATTEQLDEMVASVVEDEPAETTED